MIFKRRITFTAMVFAIALNFTNCADDEKKPDEVVQAAATEEPAQPPEEPQTPQVDVSEVSTPVYFAFDDYTLDAMAQDSLNKLAEYLKGSDQAVVQIEGHCDERGSIEYNLALGQRRAQSVKNYLSQLGISDSRLSTISYGEEKPAVMGSNEDAWAKNRRAEFILSNP